MRQQVKGNILIIILATTAIISSLLKLSYDLCILQAKMAANQRAYLHNRLEAETILVGLESDLVDNNQNELPSNIKFVQFVPDSLEFLESEGVNYYKIEVENLDIYGTETKLGSIFAVRADNLPQAERYQNTKELILKGLQNYIKLDDFSKEITLVDSRGKHKVDNSYLWQESGKLWKVDIINCTPIAKHIIFTLNKSNISKLKLLNKPLVCRADYGSGRLIFLFIHNAITNVNNLHVVYEDTDIKSLQHKVMYTKTISDQVKYAVLRNGMLLIVVKPSDNWQLQVFDCYNGKLLTTANFVVIKAESMSAQEPVAIKVINNKSLSKYSKVILYKAGEILAEANVMLDYPNLGRRGWFESFD